MVQLVEVMIRCDRRVTVESVAAAIECTHGSAYCMIANDAEVECEVKM
jgi:hypothetical protein